MGQLLALSRSTAGPSRAAATALPSLRPISRRRPGRPPAVLEAPCSPDRIAPVPNELHGVSQDDALAALDKLFKVDVDPARTAAIIVEPVPIKPPGPWTDDPPPSTAAR